MAQKVQVLLIDDIDGSDADETVEFSLDGVAYEIDLTSSHADGLREILAAYVAAGRRTGGRAKVRHPRAVVPAQKAVPVEAAPRTVREWAKSQADIKLSDRGRIPESVMVRFREANVS